MKRRSLLLLSIACFRLCASVRADPVGGDLLVQCLAARHAVGRLLDALVRKPAGER